MDFCSIFAACCKSRTSNFMRPRNVLLAFHKNQVFAFGMRSWSKKPTKNPSKTKPEPFKNRCRKWIVFQHRFFRVSASILEPLGLPTWTQVGSKTHLSQKGTLFFSPLKLIKCLQKWRLGGLRARFSRPRGSVWEGLGKILFDIFDQNWN